MLQFIKKEIIITLITFIMFAISFYLYQSQDTDISMLKKESENAKVTLEKKKRELSKLQKEIAKNDKFLQGHPNLYFIDKPDTFDIYKVETNLKKFTQNIFGRSSSINMNKRSPKKINKTYLSYNTKIVIPYNNIYRIRRYFNYLNSNYFIKESSITYNTKGKKFSIDLDFIGLNGKKAIKERKKRGGGRTLPFAR